MALFSQWFSHYAQLFLFPFATLLVVITRVGTNAVNAEVMHFLMEEEEKENIC